MRIQRDYSRSLFTQRKRTNPWTILMLGVVISGLLVFVSLQFDQLQLNMLEAIGMAPTSTPFASDLASEAMMYFQAGNLENARAMMSTAVKQQPDNINYLFEYGWLLIENGQTEEALSVAEHAIRVAPDDARSYALKGRALMWDNPSEAILASIQGTDIDPNYAPLLAIQGVAYTNLGRWQEGIRQSQQAIELDPTDPFVQRSAYYPFVYVGRYQDAIDALEAAVNINPNLVSAYFELANIYTFQQVNEPEMALAIYYHITEMEPDNAKAYLRICETYARVENAQFDVAQPYCDQALTIDPTYASAYRQRGQMQYSRRNYEGAIESFEQCEAYTSDPDDIEIACVYLRGLAHWFLSECDLAWELLLRARDLASAQGYDRAGGVVTNISIGLFNITETCPGYSSASLPTPAPPTAIPPTPIGGFG